MEHKNIKTYVVLVAYLLLSLLSGFLLVSVFGQNPSLGVWACAGLLSFLLIFWSGRGRRGEEAWERIYPFCLVGGLAVMGFFQALQIENLRFTPAYDLDAIYGGAIQWVETGSFAGYYDYFDWFPNNLGGLCFLFVVFKLSSIFSSDYFLAAACANEVLILLTVLVVSLSAKKLWGSRLGLLALILSAGILPFWFMADAFYTDSLSVLFPVLLFYFFLRMEEKGGKGYGAFLLLSAVTASLGALIKPTVLIMGAAVFLAFLLRGKWKKAGIYAGALGVTYLVFFSLVNFYMYHTHLDPELAAAKNTPSYHWVMMGLKGNGAYDPGDYEFTRSFSSPEERDKALKEEIKNRIREKGPWGMVSLYAAKLFRCFGDGTLGLSDFLDDGPLRDTKLHQYLLYEGRYYGRYSNLCNAVFYACLLLAAVSMAKGCSKKSIKENMCYWERELPLALAFGGITVFLMHWETSPRYITNYVPVILLLAVGGVRRFDGQDNEKRRKDFFDGAGV